jgi:hypothetical protein
MEISYIVTVFLMIMASLFALILTLRGYDWAIDKVEHLLFKTDYPGKLGDRISRRILG